LLSTNNEEPTLSIRNLKATYFWLRNSAGPEKLSIIVCLWVSPAPAQSKASPAEVERPRKEATIEESFGVQDYGSRLHKIAAYPPRAHDATESHRLQRMGGRRRKCV